MLCGSSLVVLWSDAEIISENERDVFLSFKVTTGCAASRFALTLHMGEPNISPQGGNHFVSEMFDRNIRLWKLQLRLDSFQFRKRESPQMLRNKGRNGASPRGIQLLLSMYGIFKYEAIANFIFSVIWY